MWSKKSASAIAMAGGLEARLESRAGIESGGLAGLKSVIE
jgi:hypothetical protein